MNLNKIETKAIKIWASPQMYQYRYLKKIISDNYRGSLYDYYKKYADTLIGLFDKYEDNTEDKILYRGDVLETSNCELNEEEIYQNYLANNPIGKCIELENTILSFTLSKDVAVKSYENSDKNKKDITPTILYILEKRISTFIDISYYSKLPHEEEVLCNKNIKFKVLNIEIKDNNHLVYYLEECAN
jgi:hypothetical protein